MKSIQLGISTLMIAGLVACGGKQTTTEEISTETTGPVPAGPQPVAQPQGQKAAVKNSFWKVHRHLDQGGNFYLYLGTEQATAKVDQWLENLTNLMELAGTDMPEQEAAQMRMAINIGRALYQQSGLRDISGLGMSSFALEEDLHRNAVVLHHYEGEGDGLLWKLMGAQAHDQEVLGLLPADTALVFHTDADVVAGYSWAQEFIKGHAPAPVVGQMAEAVAQMNQAFNFEALLKSTGGELGFFVTLDYEKRLTVPIPDLPPAAEIKIPEPAVALTLRVKDDQLMKFISAMIENPQLTGGIPVNKTTVGTTTLYTANPPEPLPVPLDISPTLMQAGNYLVLTSSQQLARDILAVQEGKQPGLKGTEEFKRLAGDMDLKGNQLHFLSGRIGREYGAIMRRFMDVAAKEGEAPPEAVELLKKMYGGDGDTPVSSQLAVVRVTSEGVVVESRNTGDGFESALMAAAIVPVGVGAALMLPAIQSARKRAREVQSMNQLRQLAMGFHSYHQDQGALPPADKWCDALLPYVGDNKAVFVSPIDYLDQGSSYAFNKHLAGVKIDDIKDPEKTVLIFESDLDWNGAGTEEQIFALGGSYLIGFADGHVERLDFRQLEGLKWMP